MGPGSSHPCSVQESIWVAHDAFIRSPLTEHVDNLHGPKGRDQGRGTGRALTQPQSAAALIPALGPMPVIQVLSEWGITGDPMASYSLHV